MTPLSSVFDKSKATLINLSCHNNLPPSKNAAVTTLPKKRHHPQRSAAKMTNQQITSKPSTMPLTLEMRYWTKVKVRNNNMNILSMIKRNSNICPQSRLQTNQQDHPHMARALTPRHSNSQGNPCWAKTEPNIERKTKTNNE
jgi:hypothetical protein